MSIGTQTVESGGTAVAEANLLEQCYAATKQTDKGTTLALLKNLTDQVEKKNVDWEVNLSRTIQNAIDKLDAMISKQLAAVLHHPDFQQLEGSYRGLHHLVMNSETSSKLKIKVMSVTKDEVRDRKSVV